MHHDPKLGVQLTYINFHPLQKCQSSGNPLLDQKQSEFEKPFEPFLNVAKLPKRSSHSNQFWLLHLGPGSAATLPQDQLRPYPCQGSAATLPTRILWKGQRFLPLSRVSCDPTWLQCKESYRFLHCFEVIEVQVQHSFDQILPPPLATHALRPYLTTFLLSNFPPPLATHAFNDSSSSTTFLLSIFSPPLGNPCFATLPDNIPFITFFPPPWATHALRPYLTTFLLSNFPPPWQPMLCDPTWQHSFYQIFPSLATHAFNGSSSSTTFLLSNFSFALFRGYSGSSTTFLLSNFPPPLGNPCFATLPDNIPFIKFSSPLGNPCFQWLKFKYHIPFIKIFPPPLATHALRPYLTTFLLSNFSPRLGNPCFATLPDNIPFIKFSPPANPCFQWFKFKYNIPFYQIFLPHPWQPMLCDPTWQHSFYQIFPLPLGNLQWFKFKYNIPFIKFPPPPGNPCFATLPDNIPFIKFSPPWQPMLSMVQIQVQHSFYHIFPPPPLPTHALRPYLTTFLLSKFPPPLGKPCFATLPDNITFIKFSPPLATHAFNDQSSSTTFLFIKFFPPLATHALRPYLTTFLLSNFPPPPWQPSMIQVQVQHSFYQIFLPSPWQPMLCDPTWQHSFYQIFPSLATHAFNGSSSSTTFLLSNFSLLHCFEVIQVQVQHSFYQIFLPPLATHALRPYLTTFLLSNFPPLGNPWFQWFQFKYNIPFIKFFPPPLATHALRPYLTTFLSSNFSPRLGNPCFATLPDNIPFIKISALLPTHAFNDSSSSTTFLFNKWFKFKYNIPFIKFFPPPLATHALRPYLTTFLLSNFPLLGNPCFQWFKFKYNIPFIKFSFPPWQPMLCDPTCQHSFYQNFPPPLGKPCFATLPDNIPFLSNFSPPLGNPCFATLPDNIPFYQIFPPLATHAFNDSNSSTTFLLSNFSPSPWQPMLCDPTWQHSFYQIFPPLGNPCFQWFKFKYNIPFIKFSPTPWANHALRPYLTTFLFIKFPPLGNPCFQWFKFKYNIPFMNFSPPPGNPCFATLPDNIFFIKFPPPLGNPCFQWSKFKYNIPFYQIFSPPLATHALRPYLTTFLLSNFPPPPWQPSMIQVQVQHSFYQIFLPHPMLCDPTWQHSFYQIFPSLATHAFNGSSSSTTFLLSNFSLLHCFEVIQVQVQHSFYQIFLPPLATHALRPYLTTFLLSNFPPPLATHDFNGSSSSTTFFLSNFFPPPLATHALRPYLTTFLLSNFSPRLGNPCFATLPDNIPFIKISALLPTHAFNDSSSSTTFLFMLSMVQVQVQHSFYQIFPFCTVSRLFRFKYNIPFIKFSFPPWQPMLCDPTWQHSFYQISPPLGNPWFQWFQFKYNILFIKFFPPLGNPCFATLPDNIPFIKFFPPPWQPMLCDPTWQHSFYQNFCPPANACFQWFKFKYNIPFLTNDSSSSTTFLLSNFSPPLATHALRPYLTTFLLSNFPRLGNPCFQWFKFKYNIPFITFFPPPLATHALRPYLPTFLLSKFSPPPGQTMLCDPTWQHSFFIKFSPTPWANHALRPYLTTFLFIKFPPLGNPCFQWFKFRYNIPFIKIFAPPPLATHALRPYLTTFLWSNFPPPLATHGFHDSSSSTTFLL